MSKRATEAGPSSAKGRITKTIPKTADLLHRNESARGKGKGKGKEREVFGHAAGLVFGAKELPGALQVERFAEARALEILALQNAIKSAAGQNSTRVFQSLPRHLRRRAASHNPRRVPQRMRSRAAQEIDPDDKIAKMQRKRAKMRSKGNLRGESRTDQLMKRQRDKTWLPTHVYHAKRFHMVNLWHHRLALTPTLKSFRPAHRASRRKAILHDTSYFGVIELEGERGELVAALSRVTAGRFAGEKYETGARVANVVLYRPGSYPFEMIGPAELCWHDRQVWLRLHPSIYDEAWKALKAEWTGIMRDLRLDLGGFEVMGPLAGEVLRRVLKCRDKLELGDPASMPEGMVIGINAYDPRLSFPPAKAADAGPAPDPSRETAATGLWDADVRDSVAYPKYKKSDLDRRRQKLELPGTRLRALAQDDRVPMLVFQRRIGDMSGYTLLFPRAWAMALLPSFVYTGTMIGGLRERRSQHREAGVPCFPEHWGAVCKAGRDWASHCETEDEARWLRKPPAKRVPRLFTADWTRVFGEDVHPWLFTLGVGAGAGAGAGTAAGEALRAIIDAPTKLGSAVNAFRRQRGMGEVAVRAGAVLHVRVEVLERGSPGDLEGIYLDETCGQLIGYTSTGNFSLSRGRGFALATVSLEGYAQAAKAHDGAVTVRALGSGVPRLARIVPVGP